MSSDELLILQKYLKKNLKKSYIRSFFSSVVSSVLFVRKSDEELRFCVDYRSLNFMIVKNRYSLSLIRETLNRLSKAVIYSKLNIIEVFNRLKMTHDEK